VFATHVDATHVTTTTFRAAMGSFSRSLAGHTVAPMLLEEDAWANNTKLLRFHPIVPIVPFTLAE
jgi:hypothetical protein